MSKFGSFAGAERAKERAAAARRRTAIEKRHAAELFPSNGTAHQKAAHVAGGAQIGLQFKPIEELLGPNGGCGAPIHMPGTNGGSFPCG